MNRTLKLIVIIMLSAALTEFSASEVYARKIKMRHSTEKLNRESSEYGKENSSIQFTPDSISIWPTLKESIKLYGFDKTATSSKESLFIVNRLDSLGVSNLTLDIEYIDLKGRQLHRRQVEVECDIPAGETRRLDFPTWDTQKSFYYRLSSKPRRQATPFEVKVTPLKFGVTPMNTK